MVCGVGIDSVEIARIRKAMGRRAWLERLFSGSELDRLRERGFPAESVAGHFAAKEAVGKALGLSMCMGDFSAIEIEGQGERPRAKLSAKLKRKVDFSSSDVMHISVSHDKGRAVALALWERRE